MDLFYVPVKHSVVFDGYNKAVIIVPPKKIEQRYYECSNRFYLDPILDMFKDEDKYGIALLSGEIAVCYNVIISGKNVEFKKIEEMDIRLIGQTSKGGQSAQRIERIRDGNYQTFVKYISELLIKCYVVDNKCTVKSLVLAGPARMKYSVADNDLIKARLTKHITKMVDTKEISDGLVRNVYYENQDAFVDLSTKIIYDGLMKMIRLADDRLVFGDDIPILLEQYQLKCIYTSRKDFDMKLDPCEIVYLKNMPMDIEMIGIKWY